MSENLGQKTLDTINQLAENLNKTINQNKENALDHDSPNGKYKRTYNQNEACQATGTHTRKINSIVETLNIDYEDGKKWCIDIDDVQKIKRHLGHREFKEKHPDHKVSVWCVSNLKGGVAKTISTVTLGTGIATECLNQYRVGIIDLDPQGTSSLILKPNFNDDDMSVGDLLMGNYDLDEGETFEELCKESFYETNIPNLKVLCSREDDRDYELFVKEKEMEANEKGEKYVSYEDLMKIIDSVKDDFDFIFIDTPPQFSAMTFSGHFVADNLLIPMKPSENDRDSSAKYINHLAAMYKLLYKAGHDGYKNIKILITAKKKGSIAQQRIAHNIRVGCGNLMLLNEMYESEAVTNCAEDYCTVYDVSASEYSATKASLRAAQSDFKCIVDEIEEAMLQAGGY